MQHILLFIYNSYRDPIVQGSVLSYIKRYKTALNGRAKFTLITFEQEAYSIVNEEIPAIKKELAILNIAWYPQKYHTGGLFLLFKKIYDLIHGYMLARKIATKKRIDLIYTVGSISGAMGYYLSKILKARLLVHTFEPHSEFMLDFKIWHRYSPAYLLLHHMENKLIRRATYIMTGTDAMIKRIENRRTNNGIFKVPSCVDLEKFKPLSEIRGEVRKTLALNNKLVLLYLGKFGGIYFTKEPFVYFKYFLEYFEAKNPHILIISPNDPDWIINSLAETGIRKNFTVLNNIPFSNIQDYINAADIGYCGIPPLPSQKYRSPIKNGEYLACGLPYIVYSGVSEDDKVALADRVGVVVKSNNDEMIIKSLKQVDKLLSENKEELIYRCRNAAKKYRAISNVDDIYKMILG